MPRTRKNGNGLNVRIGRSIREARARIGITQATLAERIGVEVETVSRIETGNQLPSLERLEQVAHALGVSLCALVSNGEAMDTTISAALAELPRREQQFVYSFVVDYARHWKEGQAKKP